MRSLPALNAKADDKGQFQLPGKSHQPGNTAEYIGLRIYFLLLFQTGLGQQIWFCPLKLYHGQSSLRGSPGKSGICIFTSGSDTGYRCAMACFVATWYYGVRVSVLQSILDIRRSI